MAVTVLFLGCCAFLWYGIIALHHQQWFWAAACFATAVLMGVTGLAVGR